MNISSPHSQNCARRGFSRRGGFTLIELLVVIAIIALLAGITFPVLARVREGGRTAACSSNLKQLGLAFRQYLQDNTGRFPATGAYTKWANGSHWVTGVAMQELADLTNQKPVPADCTADSTPPCNKADVEHGALYQYVRSPAVYMCPSNPEGQLKHLSYSMNCAIGLMGEARVKSVSEVVLLVDEEKANDGFFFAAGDPADKALYPFGIKVNGRSTDKLTEFHNGGGNLLFIDGHVKFYPFKTFPLDDSKQGWINKSKKDGVPRFHEPSFGPYGSFTPPVPAIPDPKDPPTDACAILLK